MYLKLASCSVFGVHISVLKMSRTLLIIQSNYLLYSSVKIFSVVLNISFPYIVDVLILLHLPVTISTRWVFPKVPSKMFEVQMRPLLLGNVAMHLHPLQRTF